ncbi:3-oxoacyl-[acyl-carrier-protein] synthase III C-terminal domain-containing protein [Nodularia sp. LEGE 06071]|uniref:3-oxoacyl-[acyl-carrier-protein] synthase III C-terminal domain-containing protein n=1 Tax=unclassified Nodularia (in: cyanobacteria) TaxID=2656917 RepID=UPI001D114D0F|nr:3-oxoacyl-[acyl-carrier-protein] synthase III C-terminal domain-containing protein [Nodularia sp. LEGE 06071]
MSTHSTLLPIGICSLAISFPEVIRTNDYWQKKYPELVISQPKRNRKTRSPISHREDNGFDIWSQEVAPYLSDSFRGSLERRVLGEHESSLDVQCRAAMDALTAAKLTAAEVDVVLVTALFAHNLGMDNTTQLARKLGLKCPVWSLDSTCSSALIALQNAHALIQTGEYRNALIVVSHFGSNTVRETDTLAWSMGDGAGAFIVSHLQPNQGVLANKVVSTTITHSAYSHELEIDQLGKPQIITQTGENAGSLAETAVDFVRTCCQEVAVKAGVNLAEIDFFVFNTPTAWYANVCTRALGIPPERTINLYPYYGNIGPVFPLANLYHAVKEGKITENSLILIYTNGASATAAATIMRWGDVGLGTAPAPAITSRDTTIQLQQIEQRDGAEQKLSKAEILAAQPEEQQQIVQNYLIAWLSHSLQLLPDEIDPQQTLTMWLDSLMAFSLRSRIEADWEIRVPIENFFGENNLINLTQLILDRLALSNLLISPSVNSNEDLERETLSL